MMTWCDLVCRQFDRQVSSDYALQQDASVQTVAAPRESAAFFTRSQRRSHETPLQGEETRPTKISHDPPRYSVSGTALSSWPVHGPGLPLIVSLTSLTFAGFTGGALFPQALRI